MIQTSLRERTNREQPLRDQLNIMPIETVDPAAYPEAIQAYFTPFGLDGDWFNGVHWFGSFESGGFQLAAHLYQPVQYQATIILLHGYLNHSGQFRHLIRFLIKNGYAVAVYDLPGHGLSSGERATIESFDQYVQTTKDFISLVQSRLEGPYHTIGFSTGCSILIEMLLNQQAAVFDKIVLAAPLIHWTAYEQSKGTYWIYKEFTDKIARFHRKNSSDKDFLTFNKTKDYLHCKHLSLKWVKALFDWNDMIEPMGPSDREILVIQGDKDGTVDWKYNMKLMRKKFPNADIKMIPGANHELFNEATEYKQKALNYIPEYFRQDLQDEQDL